MSYNTRIKLKSDTESNWLSQDPVLLDGEVAIVKCDGGITRKKIGDGYKKFSELSYDEPKSLGLTSASVGQIPKVKAVDSNGVPTEWEPATLPSGGGTGTPVQIDWNQNDETASDYIKNRPFYNKKAFEDIIWDGVIGNKESQHVEEMAGSTDYVLVSNEVISSSALIGAKIVLSSGDEVICTSGNISESEDDISIQFGDASNDIYILIIRKTTDENALICKNKGIYFTLVKRSNATTYTSELVFPENVVKLDSKYLSTATTTSVGAIKVGNGLSISDDGTLSVTTATYYTGMADPVNTLGADGDLYLQTEG